jgi:hypothetical protein
LKERSADQKFSQLAKLDQDFRPVKRFQPVESCMAVPSRTRSHACVESRSRCPIAPTTTIATTPHRFLLGNHAQPPSGSCPREQHPHTLSPRGRGHGCGRVQVRRLGMSHATRALIPLSALMLALLDVGTVGASAPPLQHRHIRTTPEATCRADPQHTVPLDPQAMLADGHSTTKYL